jgi:hypothetical protein
LVFISQKTAFFIVTAVKASNLTNIKGTKKALFAGRTVLLRHVEMSPVCSDQREAWLTGLKASGCQVISSKTTFFCSGPDFIVAFMKLQRLASDCRLDVLTDTRLSRFPSELPQTEALVTHEVRVRAYTWSDQWRTVLSVACKSNAKSVSYDRTRK